MASLRKSVQIRQLTHGAALAVLIVGTLAFIGASIVRAQAKTTGSHGAKTLTAISQVYELNQPAAATSSTKWVDLPGARKWVDVPAHAPRAMIMARFSASSSCNGGSDGSVCGVRIRIGGISTGAPFDVDQPFAFAFDTDVAADDGFEVGSIDRSRVVLAAGRYLVRVQFAVNDSSTVFQLNDWSLVVERFKK